MILQNRLQEDLRYTVGRLGGRPISLSRPGKRDGLGGGRKREAGELVTGQPRQVDQVGGMIGRQARGADPVCNAQAAEVLHGPRTGRIRFGVLRGFRPVVEKHTGHPPPAELHRECEADGTSTCDQDRNFFPSLQTSTSGVTGLRDGATISRVEGESIPSKSPEKNRTRVGAVKALCAGCHTDGCSPIQFPGTFNCGGGQRDQVFC